MSGTGVFVCRCGERIASHLDVEALAAQARGLPGVGLVTVLPYGCSGAGLRAIQAAIAEAALERVIVAGCTPRTLAPRLRRACGEAGLSPTCLDLVDIREGCAWVHPGQPAALAKALDLIAMGLARLAAREETLPVGGEVYPVALVIGAGPAGMSAALALAGAGVPVKLVERKTAPGGALRALHTLGPERRCGPAYLGQRLAALAGQPKIELLLESRVVAVSGAPGHYSVRIATRHGGLAQESTHEVGAIVVASGACHPAPRGLYGYDGRTVVTQLDFEGELRAHEHSPLASRPEAPHSLPALPRARGEGEGSEGILPAPQHVVMILCAGQRDSRRPYCSRTCCLDALKQALEVKAAQPLAEVAVLFRDLYLMGDARYEGVVRQAREAGVRFVRYLPSSPPRVRQGIVQVHDELSGLDLSLPYDRVVLATGLAPQPEASILARTLGLEQDEHGFYPEARPRLRPGTYAGPGIYVCGAAHGPASWLEAEFQGASAAFRALSLLRAGRVESSAPIAHVDEALCSGCGTCVTSCPFGAISLGPGAGTLSLSRVDPLRCRGCGSCAVACPSRAIEAPGEREILAQIEAALSQPRDGQVRVLALGCQWSGHAAAELAGARRMAYPPEVRPIEVGCSARFDPLHVLWAFYNGADGVFLGGCPPGECHYAGGNRHAQERIAALRALLAGGTLDGRRIALEWITPDDPAAFVARITAFTETVRALGPGPVHRETIDRREYVR